MSDHVWLDNDGEPIRELLADSPDALADASATVAELAARRKSWRFGHVIVDEAQDLTPMQWRMLTRRARGGSMTIVGDLAQRSIGAPGTWADHLPEALADFDYQELTINYRSPREVNELASTVLAELAPHLAPPVAIRSSGHRPVAVALSDLGVALHELVAETRAAITSGRVAVIGAEGIERTEIDGVQWLSPWQAKGLEFDTVIVVEPARILQRDGTSDSASDATADLHGLSLLFVALTRTTDRLVIAHRRPLPAVLGEIL